MELRTSGDSKTMSFQTDHIYVSAGSMHFGNNTGDIFLRTSTSGRVGVGTTAPQQKLHVSGTLQVHDNTSIYGISIGQHPGFTSYGGLWNSKATSDNGARYMIINAAQADSYITYINGDQVIIRPGQNSTTGQLKITTSGATFSGAVSASAFSGSFVGNGSGLTGISAAAAPLEDVLTAGNDAGGLSITNVNNISSIGGNFTGIGLVSASAFEVATNATVKGNLDVGEYIYHTTDSNTYMRFLGDNIQFAAGGLTFLEFSEGSSDLITFNKQGDNVNFLISGSAGTTLYASASGNVGIGTTNPSEKLHVVGNAIISGGTGDATLTIEADTDNVTESDNPNIKFKQDGGLTTADIGFVGSAGEIYTDSLANAMYMVTNASVPLQLATNGAARLTVENTGNVGIGTTAPDRNLHVKKSNSGGQVRMEVFNSSNTANSHGVVSIYSGGASGGDPFLHWKIDAQQDWSMGIDNSDGDKLKISKNFGPGTNDYLTVDTSGNVGIGTTTPDAPLTVHSSTDPEIRFGYSSTQDHRIQWDSSKVYIHADPENANASSALGLYVDGTSRLYIPDSGNVGIGTTSPDEKLSVVGNTGLYGTVSGGIVSPASLRFFTSEDGASLGDSTDSNKQKIGQITWAGKDTSLNATGEYAAIRTYLIDSNNLIQGSANEGGQIEFSILRHDVGANPRVEYTAMTINNSANVGIGTTSPDYKLDVAGDMGIDGYIYHNGDDSRIGFEGNDAIRMYTANSVRLQINSSGNVGIGTTAPTEKLTVTGNISGSGDIRIQGALGVGVAPNATDGRIDASNDIVAYSTSDERLKENIVEIQDALNKVSLIKGVEFDWKELSEEERKTVHGNTGHDIGVIAQEIEKVLPEAVTTRESGYKAVRYEKIVPLLIEAIKDQQKQINELKDIINGITK